MIRIPAGVGLVLDLDDTLYSEREYQLSGFRAVADAVGGGEALWREMVAADDPLRVASEASGIPVPDLLQIHRDHLPTLTLYPDAARFLERAAAAGRPFVVLTDGRSTTQRNKLRALGVQPAGVCISEELGFGKPDPRAYLAAAEVLGGERFCYLADNPAKDFVTPLRLGWLTVMLRDRGYNVHPQDVEVPAEYRAEFEVDSLDEVEV